MKKAVLEVNNLHIRYKKFKRVSFKSFFSGYSPATEFEAIKGVTFSVYEGDVLGVIGKNGAGKSTLLRALAGIYDPDEGFINTCNKSISLLSLGTGLNKSLTGRDNIYLTCSLMGMKKNDIDKHVDKIIEFSELGDFIDLQVRNYSSGMRSKLAFSISSAIEPDILLIDELLSVGDGSFRKKSFEKLQDLISSGGKTAVIVSHNMSTLRKLCNRIVWLDGGTIKSIGSPSEILDEYKAFIEK